jgi:hypothetical protein
MEGQNKGAIRFATYHAIGVLLAVAVLLGVMGGGFIAGLVAILLAVIGMGVLAVAHEVGRRRALVAPSATTAEVPRREVARDREIPIIASVTEAEGVCPLGYRFYVGQNWSLNGDTHGATEACPVAAGKLAEAAASLRSNGGSSLGMTICQTAQHRVVFQLSRQLGGSGETG